MFPALRLDRLLRHALAVLVAVVVLVAGIAPGAPPSAASASSPAGAPSGAGAEPRTAPRSGGAAGGSLYVNPDSQAARAATVDPRFAVLAQTPTAVWLTDPTPAGADTLRSHLARAASQRSTAAFVIYAIPARDCSQQSAGGAATHAEYRRWVRSLARVVRGADGRAPIVILEPDSLGLLGSCEGQGPRLRTLKVAARKLSRAGARVYLDGGHSSWLPASEAARRLKGAGARFARGFATNVSNYRSTAAERHYAEQVVRGLKGLGVGGQRYIVDTSRNGNPGAVAPGEWCNPDGARVGEAPRLRKRGRLDANLWVKPPGESDGVCGATAVPAGQWTVEGALSLLLSLLVG